MVGALVGAVGKLAGASIGGTAQVIGSLIGGRRRRKEQRAARAEFEQQKQAFQDFQFTNPYAGLENVAEDLTINQQASQFQAQQTDQALANAMQAAVASGGAAGGAQAIAQAALQSKQAISADIAKQEQANEMARVNQESKLQQLTAQGEEDLQSQRYLQQGELLNMAAGRKFAADQARAQATQQLIGGIGMMAGGTGDNGGGGATFGDAFGAVKGILGKS